MSTDDQTDTPTIPDAIWHSHKAAWADTVIGAINESLGASLTEESDACTVANRITIGVDNLRIERDAARKERDNSRALNNQLLDAERVYRQTLADRLAVTYETAADAAVLCDALAPRLAIEAAAVEEVAAASAFYLPDLITPDDDGRLPTPGKAILTLAQEVVKARAALARTNEALNTVKAEADSLRASHARAQADLRATDRARDSWRDAAGASARALSLAASALADIAAIR
jgi:hypothetical protein